jgi:hypothetical protein
LGEVAHARLDEKFDWILDDHLIGIIARLIGRTGEPGWPRDFDWVSGSALYGFRIVRAANLLIREFGRCSEPIPWQ